MTSGWHGFSGANLVKIMHRSLARDIKEAVMANPLATWWDCPPPHPVRSWSRYWLEYPCTNGPR